MTRKIIVIRGEPVAQALLLGPLDAECGRVLLGKAESLLAAGYRFVVLDLSALTDVDDQGAKALARACRCFDEDDGWLSLRGMSDDLESRLVSYEGRHVGAWIPGLPPRGFGPAHIEEWP